MAYVYRIENTITKDFYYGSRYIGGKAVDDLWIKYFTSSKYVKKQLVEYGVESFSTKIIIESDNNDECFWLEQSLIKDHVKLPGCLNKSYMNDNGRKIFLNKGNTVSVEKREELSKNSKFNRQVSIDGVVHRSIRAAAKGLGITEDTIHSRCISPNYPQWYKMGEQLAGTAKTEHTMQNAANKLFTEMDSNRSSYPCFRRTFIFRIQSLTGSSHLSAEQMYGVARKNANVSFVAPKAGRTVMIDGKVYASIKAAAAELYTTETTVSYRVNSAKPKYAGWSYTQV